MLNNWTSIHLSNASSASWRLALHSACTFVRGGRETPGEETPGALVSHLQAAWKSLDKCSHFCLTPLLPLCTFGHTTPPRQHYSDQRSSASNHGSIKSASYQQLVIYRWLLIHRVNYLHDWIGQATSNNPLKTTKVITSNILRMSTIPAHCLITTT